MDECGVTDHHHLIFVPATLKAVNHRQHAYACPHCKNHGEKAEVLRAPIPAPLLPKSLASPSLVAHIVTEKFDKAVPLYRIERTFADKRFHLPRQSMARWLIQVHEAYLDGFRDRLHKELRTASHVHADETEIQVLKEPGREPTQKSRMWVYRTGRGSPPILLYDYQQTREGQHARNFLKGFSGTLQTDGYSGYNALPDTILRAGCFAHCRRKFVETERALPKETLPEKRKDLDEVLSAIGQLYAVEQRTAETATKARLDTVASEAMMLQERQEKSLPVFDHLFQRLKVLEQEVLPKSLFGQAIHYALKQEAALRVYLYDPRVDIDNNACERAVKPFVIGRKNSLFSDTVAGAKASACYYSIVETAKANGLDANAYLTGLLSELAGQYDPAAIDYTRYFPWSDHIPDACRLPRKT